ncbi:hypothetical protein SMU44_09129, partial [Streptococcus mutans 11VS1]
MSTSTESGVASLDASNLSYQVERVRINHSGITNERKFLAMVKKRKAIPANLFYISDFYDPNTG